MPDIPRIIPGRKYTTVTPSGDRSGGSRCPISRKEQPAARSAFAGIMENSRMKVNAPGILEGTIRREPMASINTPAPISTDVDILAIIAFVQLDYWTKLIRYGSCLSSG
jgi:hypothetical protein